MVDLSQFAGPIGGILAVTWGSGAVMGYTFAHKTIGKRVSELRDDMKSNEAHCREQIADLTLRLREIEDRGYHGMERQAAQVRVSSTAVLLDRGEIIQPPPVRADR